MLFEWDEAKHRRNLRERGFGFGFASRIFENKVIEEPDLRREYGETRMRAVGVVNGRFLTVVYTERGAALRIISARSANRKERRQWLSHE
ncbi:MAG: BrnT family toxin [Rhodospirillales bacterium]|nr:BrnT family toxin [Rhodospirillales bacterium]